MPRRKRPPRALDIVPVTPERWRDLEALFSAKGCPGFCWCTPYRFRDAHTMDHARKRDALGGLVSASVPVGVLAVLAGVPVGWCSIAPRRTYEKLVRSRTMPVVDAEAWTLLCLFVRREHRGTGVARALVDGAVAYARSMGADVVEAYPWDTAGRRKGATGPDPTMHFGHSALYRAAGFAREGATRRWVMPLRAGGAAGRTSA
ncbi:MAG TPA: GNAT family N-acetyltransferase [Anaeromyxobacter sp.]|nr:GNAT family N-acetyltransferase [Anaeromyxobacter sp.]